MGYEYASRESSERFARTLRIILVVVVALFVLWSATSQSLWIWLNVLEFGDIFVRPFIFEFYGGLILAVIALFRIDFRNRRSIFWWVINIIIRIFRERNYVNSVTPAYLDFRRFKLTPARFFLWQTTKVLAGAMLFRNLFFGLTIFAISNGESIDISGLWNMLALPFVTPPSDMQYAREVIVPLIPALTLLVSPLLGALSVRFGLLFAVTQIFAIASPSEEEMIEERVHWYRRIAPLEFLASVSLAWMALGLFFPSNIDYNTRYIIVGMLVLSVALGVYSYRDRARRALRIVSWHQVALRIIPIVLIVLLAGSMVAVNNSIADAQKVEWLGPYVMQQVSVNRQIAELDAIKEDPYSFGLKTFGRENISAELQKVNDLIGKVRLWDQESAFIKLKPEIGLIPFVDFVDSDILRFNGSLFWSASVKPILPSSLRSEDRWYAQHLHYTHVPNGFLLLEGNNGSIVDSSKFFTQRTIYYGEGGLFSQTWSAFTVQRDRSEELGGVFYNGTGGLKISPPLSWFFDPNFFWAYRDKAVQVMRYRDVDERMETLFPYFEYRFGDSRLDILPVTDGKNSYYLVPLIVRIETTNVPWSIGNPMLKLVGYATVDTYNGNIKLYVTGKDFFSKLFLRTYADYAETTIPSWLTSQLRYPEELFTWRVDMYNFYHVTDSSTFIVAREFYEIPSKLNAYYVITKPPSFDKPEFLGILSLELRGAGGRNLAGYMVVRNDYEHLGEMKFYQVPLDSATKLLGPTAVVEALERNPEFSTLKTLLRNPRLGDNILYRIGDFDVYFIPVYTAGSGGVVAELGTVAAVGAAFNGQYHVGLGSDAQSAFQHLLERIAGESGKPFEGPQSTNLNDLLQRADILLKSYTSSWSQGKYQEAGKSLDEFIQIWNRIVESRRQGGG